MGSLFQPRHAGCGVSTRMREVALLTSSAGDGLATVVDVLTGTQLSSLKHCSSQPGSTALIAGDFVVSAQVMKRGIYIITKAGKT